MLQSRLPWIPRPVALAAGLLLGLALWSSMSADSALLPDSFWLARSTAPPSRVAAPRPFAGLTLGSIPDPGRIDTATRRHLARLPFGDEITGVARVEGLDPLLLASIVEAESSFNPDAVSAKGALGLMQVMPVHLETGAPGLDPAANLALGARLFAGLLARYGGDLERALAAYHAGPGAVDRFGGVPPFRSTRAYVRRVVALYLEHQTAISGSVRVESAAMNRAPESAQRGF